MSLATALTALDTQRDNLAANLTTMGVTAANTETLSQLVPKVLTITGGGGGTYQSKTVTPTAAGQTVTPSAGYDALSSVIINGDSDLTATNIKSGINIFGVAGSFDGSGGSATPAASPKDVNFYDYDGTCLYSYTIAEVQALSALPDLPSHDGLTCQGWNWTLADLKTENAKMNVGAMYITDDGKTRLYITIAAYGRMTVPLYISQTVANGVTIDWGDGSATQTIAGTGYVNTTHVYGAVGDYVITLNPTSGTLGLGSGSSSQCILGSTGNSGKVYCNMLQKVEMGSSVTSIGGSAFYNCYSLSNVTIPSSVTSIGFRAFYYCYSLVSITIPSGATIIDAYAFNVCYSLSNVMIPSSVTSIGDSAFYYCYALVSITIPSGVTSIGATAFGYCFSLSSVTIPSSVTSIADSAFSYCYSLASVTIPSSVTSIGGGAFLTCFSLASVTIPSSVTSIGATAFYNCYGMAEYHILRTTPPTLANINAITNIPADCKIYVPTASLAAYQTATNWSTYASKMVGE